MGRWREPLLLPPFELHRPTSLAQACGLFASLPGAAFYAGGTELVQLMKLGFARFDHLIDLKGVRELGGIEALEDGSLRIGATVTHREIGNSSLVREAIPALAEVAQSVGNARVRAMGTLGGNLCFAESHSDPAPLLVAAGAEIHLVKGDRVRRLPVQHFLQGALTVDRAEDEVMASVVVPPLVGVRLSYRKIALVERPVVGAAVRLDVDDQGIVSAATVVAGSATEIPLRLEAAERVLAGCHVADLADAADDAGRAADDVEDVEDDALVSAHYRRHLLGVVIRRAIAAAASAPTAAGAPPSPPGVSPAPPGVSPAPVSPAT